MKTKVVTTESSYYIFNGSKCYWRKGEIGYIDGYNWFYGTEPYAYVVIGTEIKTIPLNQLQVIID
jgi:hypothetical protein